MIVIPRTATISVTDGGHRLPAECRPTLVRGDKDWGNQRNMRRCEQEGVHYLFKLRLTRGVRRLLEKAMGAGDWQDAGQGWCGREAELRLEGWSRQRRVILLRRRLKEPVADQPPAAAAWYRPPDPPCRPDPPDHHRQPRPPSPRGPGASPNCHVLRRPAPNCGAVDRRRTLAPHPQPSTRQVSPRPTTAAAPLATGRMRG